MEIFAALGHRRGMARVLEGYACLALTEGHAKRALTLAAAAAQLRRRISAPLSPVERSKLDRTLVPAWESLSDQEGKSAWEKGSAMSFENVTQYSLEDAGVASSDLQGQ